ncbi:MAG: AsmA family protein [Deltaproteobacteria bacterium]|nr:AsmA family protein [Deltaproteobacteria bacterium]
MHKLALTSAALALVLGLGLVIAAVSLNRLIAANRDAILSRVQAAAGRPVQVGGMAVRLAAGLGIGLTDITVSEDAAFGSEPCLQAAELTAGLKLWPLLRGRMEVGRMVLAAPTIRLVRSATGQWNYQSLGPAPPRAAAGAAFRPVVLAARAGGAPAGYRGEAGGPFTLLVESAAVRGGTLIIIDRLSSPPAVTTVRHVNLELRDVSRERPIGVDLIATVGGDTPNVRLTGVVGPLVRRERVPLSVKGRLGPFTGLQAVIDDLEVQAFLTPNAAELEHLGGNALGGSFRFTGSSGLSAGAPLQLAGELRGISIAQLLAVRGAPPSRSVEGDGVLRLDLHGSTGANVLRTLAGTVAADVAGGAIHDFNLASELLERTAGMPGLTQLIAGRIKPKYSRLFSGTDTNFDQLKATFRLAAGRAETNDLTATAEDFGVRAAGWFDFDRDLNLTGQLLMSKRFSDDVIGQVKEVRYLVNDVGQLAIPFELKGKLGEAKPRPDAAYLAHVLEQAVARGAAGELLGKLLGGKKPASGTPAPDAGDLLERGLRDLFGP